MALLGFAAFGLLVRRVRASRWPDSFQLYAYHPLLFPLTAMVYTDQTAVTFLVLVFLAHASKRFGWAAVALAMAAVLRQTNLVWVIVLVAWSMGQPRSETPMSGRRSKIRAALTSIAPLWWYGVVVLAAVVLVGTTGRLTAGAVPLNQPAFNINQYYVLLLFVLVLWAPVFVERAPGDFCALVQWSTERPAVAAGVGVILATTIAFLFIRYSNPHPWNHVAGLVRNWPLRLMDRFVVARPLLLLICAWSVYQTVRFTLGRSNRAILAAIWGGGLLSLSVLGLVEPRYYVPMLLLADLFNDYEPRHAAWLVRWYQCASAAACALSLTGRFW